MEHSHHFGPSATDLIVGASLQVSAPFGQYDNDRLVNIGTNRWSFKPESGISKALCQWTLEGSDVDQPDPVVGSQLAGKIQSIAKTTRGHVFG